jgi:excisionase family DNA binding protein
MKTKQKTLEIKMESVDRQLVSPRQLAKLSGWPERRVRNLIALNQIRYVKVGPSILVPTDAIDEFLQANMVNPKDRNVSEG